MRIILFYFLFPGIIFEVLTIPVSSYLYRNIMQQILFQFIDMKLYFDYYKYSF